MPDIGDIAIREEVGLAGNSRVIWAACKDCGKERWVQLSHGDPKYDRCRSCADRMTGPIRTAAAPRRDMSPLWKGGRSISSQGYVLVRLAPGDPFFGMAGKHRYVLEHRLVMAQHLGRHLDAEEEVHHRNHNKQDNRIENLELLMGGEHSSLRLETKRLTNRIHELEAEDGERPDNGIW